MASIKELRKRCHVSQRKLGDACGVASVTIHSWETHATKPKYESQKILLDLFGEIPDECKELTAELGIGYVNPQPPKLTPIIIPEPEMEPDSEPKFKEGAPTIKELRVAKHLTQEQLAKMCGVTFAAVSKWELGLKSPRLKFSKKLREVFGVTPKECKRLLSKTHDLKPERLLALRTAKNLSRCELAALIHVQPARVRDWETGRFIPNIWNREKLREIFGLPSLETITSEPAPRKCETPCEYFEPPKPPARKNSERNFDELVGKYFTFTIMQIKNKKIFKRRPITLRLKSRTTNFLIFTDCVGLTHTFTPSQLHDFTSITPATEQEVAKFESGAIFDSDF